MEFLATITAITTLIPRILELGRLKWGQKEAKLKELLNLQSGLRNQINVEGEKIERYIAFNKIVSDIGRGINSTLSIHQNTLQSDGNGQFWDLIEPMHNDLFERAMELRNFNAGTLDALDQERIAAHSPSLADLIVQAQVHFTSRGDRAAYVLLLRQATAKLGDIRPVGSRILENIGQTLRRFGS